MFEAQRVVNGQAIVNAALPLAQTVEDELELAVREHARLVYRVAYSVLRNHHDAEDATQETFIRVLRYRRTLADIRDLRTWLARIALRVAAERRRKVARTACDDLGEAVEQLCSLTTTADEMVMSTEMSAVLTKVIATLPGKLRDPLMLSTLEEMSPRDIAETLGTNEAAVRSRLFRARRVLREKLTVLLGGNHGT
jgi:RNA polymerase sigma-70 factor (ECF subfamily)